jgi:hypothetical protein
VAIAQSGLGPFVAFTGVTNDLRLLWAVLLPFTVACGSSATPSRTTRDDEGAQPEALDGGAGAFGSSPVGEGGGGMGQGGASAGGNGTGGGTPNGGTDGAVDPTGSGGEAAAGAPAAGEPRPLVLDGTPEHYRHVRLTHEQWENSVQDNLRLADPTGLLDGLSPDTRLGRYSNNEDWLEVGPVLVVDYAEAGEALAERVATDPALLAAVYPDNDALGFINEVGQRFYRRPLTTEESGKFEELFAMGASQASASDEFTGGAQLVLQVLLQSPRFLYRIESGDSGERLNGYELATKLAYFITNSTPSDALLAQAAAGALDTDEGVRSTALGLLDTARAKTTLRRFHGETFVFDAYRTISKDPLLGYAEGTNADLEEASYLFFDRIFEGSLGVRDIFLGDVGFVSDSMAEPYDLEGPGGAGFLEVRLGAERPGFFTQLPFLVLHSSNLTPNSISRGAFINDEILCVRLPDEPELASPITPREETNRETITVATAGEGCAGCHDYLNPLGFAFENFDGLGRLRDEDNGFPVDTTGSYPFVEGQLEFDGAPELMQLLAESQQVHTCYASHLAEFGLAHELGPDEAPVVDALTEASHADAASVEELVLELVTSTAFQTRQGTP